MSNEEGKYRINVVAQKTGVSAATLRAWERRYGVPVPRRTESSYRLYSDEDIDLIQRVRSLCDGGMSSGEAARVVLAEFHQPDAPPPSANLDIYAQVRDELIAAVHAFDPDALERAVNRALTLGSASIVGERVIVPVMTTVGNLWHAGEITVAQEHLASSILETTTRKLIGLVQPASGARRLVMGCFAEDEHVLPLYAASLHLAQAGFRIIMLGARTPPAAIHQAVGALSPVCVGLSVTVTPKPHRARELVDAYASACDGTPWIVGGQGTTDLEEMITERGGTIVHEHDARKLVRAIEATIARNRRSPRSA